MPKIADEAKQARREQILDGARRCFAAHGYEGATVKRLEEEIGLSRGAIFNYFPTKEDIFVELARRDNRRIASIFAEGGLDAVFTAILEGDPAWYGVYLETARRARTDPEFHRRLAAGDDDVRAANRARVEQQQRAGELRDDIDVRELGAFLNLVLNGLLLQRASGDETLPAARIVQLLGDAIGPRAPTRTRPRRSASRA